MAKSSTKVVDLSFPLGGLDRKASYQQQRPYTTPDCLNVRPTDQIRLRQRGGSRPGIIKSHLTQLGSGNPVNMLNTITTVEANGRTFWADYFDQPSLAPYWIATNYSLPAIFPDNTSGISYGNTAGAVRTTLPANFSTASEYVVEAFLVPYQGAYHGNYEIYVGTSGSTPYTNGVVVRLVMQDATGTYSGALYRYSGGSVAESYLFTNGSAGDALPGWFRVVVNALGVQVYWQENQLLNQALSSIPGSNFGFGGECTQAGGACLFDTFRTQFTPTSGVVSYRKLLVAASNGTLYSQRLAYENTLYAYAGSLTLNTDRILQSAERLQKLYIADNGASKAAAANGVVTSGVLDSATYADWTTLSISTNDDVVEVTNVSGATGGFVGGTYKITTVHATNGLTLTGASGSCTTCTFRVMRGAKVYDPSDNSLALLTTTSTSLGAYPVGCTMVVAYRDRLVFAGDPNAPHAFFASRQGDPLDFNYGASGSDAGRAVAGTNTAAGGLSEPIKALMTYSDDMLVFGCTNSIYILRGDWATGGDIQRVSSVIGVVGRFAHCVTPNGEMVFLSRDGLYMMPAGGGTPIEISRQKLPDELINLDSELYDISLVFDVFNRGIHIFISQNESTSTFGTSQYHWWFDWENKGFWPLSLPSAQQPRCAIYNSGSSAPDSAVLMGCRDGYIRRFHRYADSDDGTAISSHVRIGPILMGDGYAEGLLSELYATVAQGSGNVTWGLYSGDNHEGAAVGTTAFATGTWSAEGLNYKEHPRMRGMSGALRLSNAEGLPWAVETLSARIDRVGVQRK